MEQKHCVSAAQFFLAMFVSQVAATLSLNAQYAGGEHLLDNTVSYLLAMALGFVIALPVWLLHRRCPGLNVNEIAKLDLGRPGKLVPLCYLLYFTLVNGATLALFQIFLLDTVNPDFSAGFVVAALLGAGLYGALRGMETVARCATCVFVVLILGCGLVFGMVSLRFRAENLEPLFYQGFSQTLQGTALFLARTSVFADMAILLPLVRGRKARGYAWWSGGTAAFVCLLLLLVVGCLGPYAAAQNFPVYTLASVTRVRSLQRLDAVFVGVWIAALVIRLACELYACRLCAGALLGPGRARWGAAAAAGLTLALAYGAVGVLAVQRVVLDLRLLLGATLAAGFLLPALVWLADLVKARRGMRPPRT